MTSPLSPVSEAWLSDAIVAIGSPTRKKVPSDFRSPFGSLALNPPVCSDPLASYAANRMLLFVNAMSLKCTQPPRTRSRPFPRTSSAKPTRGWMLSTSSRGSWPKSSNPITPRNLPPAPPAAGRRNWDCATGQSDIPPEVVPQPHVQRQAARHTPVVLDVPPTRVIGTLNSGNSIGALPRPALTEVIGPFRSLVRCVYARNPGGSVWPVSPGPARNRCWRRASRRARCQALPRDAMRRRREAALDAAPSPAAQGVNGPRSRRSGSSRTADCRW